MYTLANIIFPAPSAVYVSTWFVPLATVLALATEYLVYMRVWRGSVSAGRLLAIMLVLNICSWIAGLVISEMLPTGLVPRLIDEKRNLSIIEPGPQWGRLAILGLVVACIVSTAIEYAGFRVIYRRISLRSPLKYVSAANIAGYAVLSATVAVFMWLDLI
ncbi:MAG: hypothetical protein IT436_12680 [Phycisphaerales bacterium]|nr:hypothetical protein [Phycisphaerales bacterium]